MKGRNHFVGAYLIFLLLRISYEQVIVISEERIPEVLRYDEPTTIGPNDDDFIPLLPVRRQRRAAPVPKKEKYDSSEDIDPATATLPTDVVAKNDSVDHQYYIAETHVEDAAELKKHWVNIDNILGKSGVVGNRSHPLLSKSYRRAVGSRMTFKFPFYGHKMSNLTIATGGFIYIGDQTHNWLAATQYIAPLMANFHTYLNNSNIIYADDGEIFVVEWRNVQLREDTQNNTFSFQAILHKNGDIVFAYKDIPLDVGNISDANHPVKLGISDAYLFNHSFDIPGASSAAQPKRVIYEYHRIEVSSANIKPNTVVILKAQPTCIQFETCDSCSNSTLKHFNCQWCHSKKKHGGPFCTDESGLHRRRQHWVEGNCHDKSKSLYCDSKDEEEVYDEEDYEKEAVNSETTTGEKQQQPDGVVPLKGSMLENGVKTTTSVSSGVISFSTLVLMLGTAICFIGWLAYAYYNPHTTSGQLLIKYRPSRWHVPSSHVRYSASVHM